MLHTGETVSVLFAASSPHAENSADDNEDVVIGFGEPASILPTIIELTVLLDTMKWNETSGLGNCGLMRCFDVSIVALRVAVVTDESLPVAIITSVPVESVNFVPLGALSSFQLIAVESFIGAEMNVEPKYPRIFIFS